jgi:hypothetical protein
MCVSREQVRLFKVEGKTLTITTAMDDQRTERERNQALLVGNQTNRRALCGLAGGICFTLTPNVFPGSENMWLALTATVLAAAIGFNVLAIAIQRFEA